jgi:hypothetical protein
MVNTRSINNDEDANSNIDNVEIFAEEVIAEVDDYVEITNVHDVNGIDIAGNGSIVVDGNGSIVVDDDISGENGDAVNIKVLLKELDSLKKNQELNLKRFREELDDTINKSCKSFTF